MNKIPVSLAALALGMMILLGASASPAQQLKVMKTLPDGSQLIEIIGVQDVILDAMPVAVVYEPPGAAASQKLTLTSNFVTKTTLTSLRTTDYTASVTASYNFSGNSSASGTGGGGVGWSYNAQTSTWTTTISSVGWSTSEHRFPGGGDLVVFYKRPHFRITMVTGTMIQDRNGVTKSAQNLKTPQILSVEPVKDPPSSNPANETWVLVAESASDMRSSNGNQIGGPGVVMDLLQTDPYFATLPLRPVVQPVALGSGGSSGDVLSRVSGNPARYSPLDSPYQWQACGAGESVALTKTSGHSSSITYTHTSKVSVSGTLKVPVGPVSLAISPGAAFSFQYSTNTYTEQDYTTASSATIGGGASSCSNQPWYLTYIYYDNTFGTIIFPTETLPGTNVSGAAASPQGAPVPRQLVLAQSSTGKAVRTFTDARGDYHFYLPPGQYMVEVQDRRGNALSGRQVFNVASAQQAVRVPALRTNPR